MAFENSGPIEFAHQKYNSQVVSSAHRPQPHICRLRTEWRTSHFCQEATVTSPASRGPMIRLIYTARSYDLYTHSIVLHLQPPRVLMKELSLQCFLWQTGGSCLLRASYIVLELLNGKWASQSVKTLPSVKFENCKL